MKKVVFTEEAEQDLREAVSWHKSRLKAEVDKRAGSLNPNDNEGSQQRQV